MNSGAKDRRIPFWSPIFKLTCHAEVGWIGTTEVQAHMFLAHERNARSNVCRTLDNKWALLRSGIRSLGLSAEDA